MDSAPLDPPLRLGREVLELLADVFEHVLRELDEVHLVHAHREVGDPDERGHERVALGLLGHALARVDQDQREVGRGGARDHVARVADMPGRVREDEAPARGGEVAVRHVDRDALLALGPQAVGKQREVGVLVAPAPARLLDVLQLVGEHLFRVEQQAPDQGALAVVDGAGGGDAECACAAFHHGIGLAVALDYGKPRSH